MNTDVGAEEKKWAIPKTGEIVLPPALRKRLKELLIKEQSLKIEMSGNKEELPLDKHIPSLGKLVEGEPVDYLQFGAAMLILGSTVSQRIKPPYEYTIPVQAHTSSRRKRTDSAPTESAYAQQTRIQNHIKNEARDLEGDFISFVDCLFVEAHQQLHNSR